MSTVVCQGLQNCLETQLIETRILRLKVASSPKPSNPDLGGWSFFQSLSNSNSKSAQIPKQAYDKETFYVHPMAKQSSSILSYKSLELCTENLGSETGTDMNESDIFSLSPPVSVGGERESPVREQPKSRKTSSSRNFPPPLTTMNFPPPLTTMNGSNPIQVRPHREGGRLIIEAVEAPPTHSVFQTERSHGRLRLNVWRECVNTNNSDLEILSEEKEHSDMEVENEGNDEEKEEEEEECEDEDREEESDVPAREDMDGNFSEVGVEMGIEKFQRSSNSRCNEGGLCNWDPFLVATS